MARKNGKTHLPDPPGSRKIDKVRSTARVDGWQAMCQVIWILRRGLRLSGSSAKALDVMSPG